MRKIKNYTIVEANPNEIDMQDILLERLQSGKVNVLKRNDSGELISIVEDTTIIANPSVGITQVSASDEFSTALNELLGSATAEGATVSITPQITSALDTLKKYLPDSQNSSSKNTNKINVSGYYDSTKVVISTTTTVLKAVFSGDSQIILTKFEL